MAKDIVPYTEPPRLTGKEVRAAASIINRRRNVLGALAQGVTTGSMNITTKNGSMNLTLKAADVEALAALMVERDELFLIQMNIEYDR